MKISSTTVLVCVSENCRTELQLDPEFVEEDEECIEGFLRCDACHACYPVIGGIPIIVSDLANYIGQRHRVLGRWITEGKSDSIKRFLKDRARNSKDIEQNRYEEGGAWFEPYLYMHSANRSPDENFRKIIRNDFDELYSAISNMVKENVPRSRRCLDLGCATGTLAERFSDRLDFVIGVDQSYSFLKHAHDRVVNQDNKQLEFVVADALNLPFYENYFDLIVTMNMLDLVRPDRLISHLYSVLEDRGSLVLVDPYDFRDKKGNPVSDYNGTDIRTMLMDRGFEIACNSEQESFLPWVLRVNKRAYLVYFTDVVLAKKNAR